MSTEKPVPTNPAMRSFKDILEPESTVKSSGVNFELTAEKNQLTTPSVLAYVYSSPPQHPSDMWIPLLTADKLGSGTSPSRRCTSGRQPLSVPTARYLTVPD
ncbi:hypothetical protein BDV28DRAFT_152527 [Aspergillus coremiiformis]|uniref:Uncharacterized protein n=1 Tax=Aspergillus coremiiformis TaxID=138285 RepID=A0A5N6YUI9_9EURO|nr:hypothetical protein BDV28DRAFT_152527 [Aspergillus coremiiformis]